MNKAILLGLVVVACASYVVSVPVGGAVGVIPIAGGGANQQSVGRRNAAGVSSQAGGKKQARMLAKEQRQARRRARLAHRQANGAKLRAGKRGQGEEYLKKKAILNVDGKEGLITNSQTKLAINDVHHKNIGNQVHLSVGDQTDTAAQALIAEDIVADAFDQEALDYDSQGLIDDGAALESATQSAFSLLNNMNFGQGGFEGGDNYNYFYGK